MVVEEDRVASLSTMTGTYRDSEGKDKEIVTDGMDLFYVSLGLVSPRQE